MSEYRPVTLVILDGWGESPEPRGNAVLGANLPTINELNQYYPKITLQASGIAVGLPWLQAGNSEVGHQIIGTGQVIFQYLPLISNAISSGTFFKNQVLLDALQSVKEKKSRLHLIGLTSNGGVHSHLDHLFALLELSRWQGLSAQTFIHVITDGRDTPIHNAGQFISRIQAATGGNIATIMGRYYAMDRNNNWDRIQKAYLALTEGKGIPERDPLGAINKQYEENLGDEHIKPIVIIDKENRPVATINENDTVIFYNFRKDRARQLTEAFVTPGFQPFPQKKYQHLKFVCFAEYKEGLKVDIAFPPQKIEHRISEIISQQDLEQLKIAETEKYAHVTYFYNGGQEKPFPGERQLLIPSKNAPSYAAIPEMSAYEVTHALLEEIKQKNYAFILLNYANPDMVGHTGDFQAGIKAVQIIDECLRKVIKAVLEKNGCLLITADHGNCEEMINLKTGNIDTQHSNNPVPCWFVTPNNRKSKPQEPTAETKPQGMLVDLAPTTLELLGIKKPPTMRGISLLELLKTP